MMGIKRNWKNSIIYLPIDILKLLRHLLLKYQPFRCKGEILNGKSHWQTRLCDRIEDKGRELAEELNDYF